MTQRNPTTNDYCEHGYADFGRLCPVCNPWPSDRLVVGRFVTLETRDGVTTIRRRARRGAAIVAGVVGLLVLSSSPSPAAAAGLPCNRVYAASPTIEHHGRTLPLHPVLRAYARCGRVPA